MKNKLIALGLVAGFSLAGLASCGDAILKEGEGKAVLTIGNETITADDLLKEFKETNSTGVAAFYNAISEVLIRNATKKYAESSELQSEVNSEIEKFKEKAKNNAEANGTKYKEELNNALKEEGVEDLDEYKDKFIYKKLQAKLTDTYYETQTKELLGDYIDEVIPYHVRHILVNVSASGESITNATISEQEAINLSTVVRRIANVDKDGKVKPTKETFGEVAFDASDDDASAKQYGDLGIMSTKTSYVNEFKLGIYAYESLYAAKSAPRATLFTDDSVGEVMGLTKNTYSIPADAQSFINGRAESFKAENKSDDIVRRKSGIGYIPFEYTQKLEEVASITKTTDNKVVNDGDANYYPRNIYFSAFFNDHGINVITNKEAVGNFKVIDGLFDNQPVLCADGDVNKVVLVTRAGSSYQGIHFMVVEKSGIKETAEDLKKYYDDRTAEELRHDKEESLIGNTFVTYLSSSTSDTQKSRANTIKSEVKGFDSMLDARIFEYYLNYENAEDGIKKVEIIDTELNKNIQTYISTTRAGFKFDGIKGNEKAWEDYIALLGNQDTYKDRKIPLVCAGTFQTGYAEGDGCYVEK